MFIEEAVHVCCYIPRSNKDRQIAKDHLTIVQAGP
jgi:hypothetical protein